MKKSNRSVSILQASVETDVNESMPKRDLVLVKEDLDEGSDTP